MKTAGIIAEYNPFHTGHNYQIDYVRGTLGADYVVIAMSGDFVQRGTPALLSKYVRAEMALRAGADLVLELPVSCATASAELFARGGVQLLDGLGVVDTLCFGSECGDTEILIKLAEILVAEPEDFKNVLRRNLKEGMTFPKARSLALGAFLPENESEKYQQVLSSPNNILGIEYCKALLRKKSAIVPAAIKREGNDYHENSLSAGSFPSASAIRSAVIQAASSNTLATDTTGAASLQAVLSTHHGQTASGENSAADFSPTVDFNTAALADLTRNFLPAACQELFYDAVFRNAFLLENDLDSLYRYCLLQEKEESLCTYLDMSHSLARRILACRDQYETFSQFADLLKTREITRTRIQRALLHMLLHIQKAPEQIPYARVLGFRKSSSALLGEIKKRGRIPLLTKLANAKELLATASDELALADNEPAFQGVRTVKSSSALPLLEETTFASNLYESILAQKNGTSYVHEYKQQIIIL